MQKFPFLVGVLCLAVSAAAQPDNIPLHSPTRYIIDRLRILEGVDSDLHPELGYSREAVLQYAAQLEINEDNRLQADEIRYLKEDNRLYCTGEAALRTSDSASYKKIYADSSHTFYRLERIEPLPRSAEALVCPPAREKPLVGDFYASNSQGYAHRGPNFRIAINPAIGLEYAKGSAETGDPFSVQVGGVAYGDWKHKLYFDLGFLYTKARFPDYLQRFVVERGAVPEANNFQKANDQVDFSRTTASLAYRVSRHITVQFGNGRHFIGNGYRSAFLSDAGANYPYLKFNTQLGRFQYQNLFVKLEQKLPDSWPSDSVVAHKYSAIHYLNFKIKENFAVGLFEAVVFNRAKQFDFQYLNPVILYRSVEGTLGSPDNVLLGFDARWDLFHRISLYGQAVLDEFIFTHLLKRDGWRGNKFAVQLGAKCLNIGGMDHLDMQVEYNLVRPFTFSHNKPFNSYTHDSQMLAHPLGANLKEWVAVLRYKPVPKIAVELRAIYLQQGLNLDNDSVNYGGDPLVLDNSYPSELGNRVGQGNLAKTVIGGARVSWSAWHNLFIDANLFYRHKVFSTTGPSENNLYGGLGLRLNIFPQNLDY